MMIRCPSCGCESSLDGLIDHEPAAMILHAALDILPIGNLLIRYTAMFRPTKAKLSWSRVHKVLGEILPMIKKQQIVRNGVTVDASMQVWEVALEKVIQARDLGSLKTPLKTHGYLFEVIVSESQKAENNRVNHVQKMDFVTEKPRALSATEQALATLESMKKPIPTKQPLLSD